MALMYYVIKKYIERSRARRIILDALLLAIAGLIGFLIWWGAHVQDASSAHTDHIVCVQIELLKRGFTDSLERGKRSIPTLAYYRAHPVERRKALDEINRQLRLYAPHPC